MSEEVGQVSYGTIPSVARSLLLGFEIILVWISRLLWRLQITVLQATMENAMNLLAGLEKTNTYCVEDYEREGGAEFSLSFIMRCTSFAEVQKGPDEFFSHTIVFCHTFTPEVSRAVTRRKVFTEKFGGVSTFSG